MSKATERYKFNGMEWQPELGLDLYDFGARNYDAAIGRWLNIDPLSEKYAYQSHYNFSENQVVAFRELEGLEKVHFQYVFNEKNISITKT
ncbi:MAG TPA: RHS repeat-associated core domain-containing protein, partial [Brumimicrobium sp.]|nr:RHS repeat-associated core domain-containing protein [Brumimicrobium sp.]